MKPNASGPDILNIFKIAFIVVLVLVGMAVTYRAFFMNTETRSKAAYAFPKLSPGTECVKVARYPMAQSCVNCSNPAISKTVTQGGSSKVVWVCGGTAVTPTSTSGLKNGEHCTPGIIGDKSKACTNCPGGVHHMANKWPGPIMEVCGPEPTSLNTGDTCGTNIGPFKETCSLCPGGQHHTVRSGIMDISEVCGPEPSPKPPAALKVGDQCVVGIMGYGNTCDGCPSKEYYMVGRPGTGGMLVCGRDPKIIPTPNPTMQVMLRPGDSCDAALPASDARSCYRCPEHLSVRVNGDQSCDPNVRIYYAKPLEKASLCNLKTPDSDRASCSHCPTGSYTTDASGLWASCD